jgi:hypothetical protein
MPVQPVDIVIHLGDRTQLACTAGQRGRHDRATIP